MNQIINMVIKQLTRQFINRGIKAGFDKAGEMSQRRKAQQGPVDAMDANDAPPAPQMTKQERQARRQARQNAKHGMAAVRRVSKF